MEGRDLATGIRERLGREVGAPVVRRGEPSAQQIEGDVRGIFQGRPIAVDLATGIRERLGVAGGAPVVRRGQPLAKQIAGDVRDLFQGRVSEPEAVARANRTARVSSFGGGGMAQPEPAPAPAPSPAEYFQDIRSKGDKVKFYQKPRGGTSVNPRMPFSYNYIDEGGVIGAEKRYPSGTPRTWRLLEVGTHASGIPRHVLSVESEIRDDGTFPAPPKRGTHEGRATIGMDALQGLVDSGQIDIEQIELGEQARGTDAEAQVKPMGETD